MQIPSNITFHNLDPSPALEERIKEKIDKLDQRYKGLIRCDVTVEGSSHHKNKGNLYSVHILVTLPGRELVVSQHPGKTPKRHEKVFAAMNDAFLAIEKQLSDFKQERRGKVKEHASVMQTGEIVMIDAGEEFGFLTMEDGTRLYFHRNAVHGDRFMDLALGSKVRFSFIEGEGAEGPQANFVRLLHKKTA